VDAARKVVGAAIVLGILGGIAWFAYWKDVEIPVLTLPSSSTSASAPQAAVKPLFRCDGRRQCNEMRSCEEAMFFLQHCPGTELDDDKDGIPCEVQWCQK
jgi:hypothetical protein